jgi:hypothetical protein
MSRDGPLPGGIRVFGACQAEEQAELVNDFIASLGTVDVEDILRGGG